MATLRSFLTPANGKHIKGLLRAGAYVSALTLVLGGFRARAAHAELRDRSVELGRQMLQLAPASQHDVNRVTVNGEVIYLGSAVADEDAKTVLDRYEGYCRQNSAQPIEAWRALADKNTKPITKDTAHLLSTGTLRGGSGSEGTVLCFTKTGDSKPTVGEALTAFGETGELSAFGSLRYVYAKRQPNGQTTVLTAWTDSKFNVKRLVPDDGTDAIGADFAEIPRVPSSTRMFSTTVDGTPFGVNVYKSKDAPKQIARFYDEEMQKNGWFALNPEVQEKDSTGAPVVSRLYERNGVVLTLGTGINDGETYAALGLAGVHARGDGIGNNGLRAH